MMTVAVRKSMGFPTALEPKIVEARDKLFQLFREGAIKNIPEAVNWLWDECRVKRSTATVKRWLREARLAGVLDLDKINPNNHNLSRAEPGDPNERKGGLGSSRISASATSTPPSLTSSQLADKAITTAHLGFDMANAEGDPKMHHIALQWAEAAQRMDRQNLEIEMVKIRLEQQRLADRRSRTYALHEVRELMRLVLTEAGVDDDKVIETLDALVYAKAKLNEGADQ